MKKNMGTTDRTLRIMLAAIFGTLFLTHTVTGIAGWILLAVTAVFLLTSFISFCPLYTLIGVNTCRRK